MKQVLYFTASWCQPCKMVRPLIEELKAEGLEISIVDIDEYQQMAIQYKIKSVPTFIYLSNAIEIDRKIGANINQEAIRNYFK